MQLANQLDPKKAQDEWRPRSHSNPLGPFRLRFIRMHQAGEFMVGAPPWRKRGRSNQPELGISLVPINLTGDILSFHTTQRQNSGAGKPSARLRQRNQGRSEGRFCSSFSAMGAVHEGRKPELNSPNFGIQLKTCRQGSTHLRV